MEIVLLLTRIRVFVSFAYKTKRLLEVYKNIISTSPTLFAFGSLSLFFYPCKLSYLH